MIRVWLLFLVLTALVWGSITAVQKLTGKQALDLTKGFVYAIISSSVAVVLMFRRLVPPVLKPIVSEAGRYNPRHGGC